MKKLQRSFNWQNATITCALIGWAARGFSVFVSAGLDFGLTLLSAIDTLLPVGSTRSVTWKVLLA